MHTVESIAQPGLRSGLAGYNSTQASGSLRWERFLPDLALSGALVALLYLVAFFGAPTALFRDSDAGWHIRAGELMISASSLPEGDPFSFSKPAGSWVAWEWGADVAVAAVHRAAGLGGVAALYCLAIAISVWLWFRLNWTAGGNFLLACFFASPMLSTTNLHWLARPHVFGWLFLLGFVWFFEQIPQQIRWTHLAGIACLSTVWANLHGSFFLGPLVGLLYSAGAWLGTHVLGSHEDSWRNALMTSAAAALGTLVNPHGWELHRHVFSYMADSALLDRIGEFQSFNFHAEGSMQIVLSLLVGIAGGMAALAIGRVDRFLIAVLLTAGALRSARMLPVAALVLLPLANGSITAVLARTGNLALNCRRWVDGFLAYGDALRVQDRRLSGLALVPIVCAAVFALLPALRPGFPADQFPVAASASVGKLPASARLFSSDKFGGYLIYRFDGHRKVFFDGRSDFYGADFLQSYSRMVQVRPGWTELFDRWNFTHALLPVDYSLVPALKARGWTETYRDRVAVLLAAPVENSDQKEGRRA